MAIVPFSSDSEDLNLALEGSNHETSWDNNGNDNNLSLGHSVGNRNEDNNEGGDMGMAKLA